MWAGRSDDGDKTAAPFSPRTLARMVALCPSLERVIFPCIVEGDVSVGLDSPALRAEIAKKSGCALAEFEIADGGWRSKIADPKELAQLLFGLAPGVILRAPRLSSSRWTQTITALDALRSPAVV